MTDTDAAWLVVTPAHNEADNLPQLAASLAAQTLPAVGLWVVVDDGSSDGTAEVAERLEVPFPVEVLRRQPPASGLTGGAAFRSFLAGADAGLVTFPDAERVLKLDADMVLDPRYIEELATGGGDAALVGGVITSWRDREQLHHVRGALKAYDRAAFEIVRDLPTALGLDVMDEVVLRSRGERVVVVPTAHAVERRRTGSSEGVLAGRRRLGVCARWLGYDPVYFGFRLLRYACRRPYGIGAAAMAIGWLRAGPGPWSAVHRQQLRREQRARLKQMVANPFRFVRATYGLPRGDASTSS